MSVFFPADDGELEPQPEPEPDPLAPRIEQARARGWTIIPNIGYGVVDHALLRRFDQWTTDVVTIPPFGDSTVVRLHGAIDPARPRQSLIQWWRHDVPVPVALDWLLGDPENDEDLLRWTHDQRSGGPQ